jgi:hypothetical protein
MSSDLSGGHMLRAAGDAALAIEQVSWVLIVGATVIFGGVMLLLGVGAAPPGHAGQAAAVACRRRRGLAHRGAGCAVCLVAAA